MLDTPQFRLDVAELKLEELADAKASLVETQNVDRTSRMQALSVTHRSEYTALVERQHNERLALTYQINRDHASAKTEISEKIRHAKDDAKRARRDLTRQQRAAEADAIAANVAAQFKRNSEIDEQIHKLKEQGP